MSALAPDRIPVILGIGEITDRPREFTLAPGPVALMEEALRRTAADARARKLQSSTSTHIYVWSGAGVDSSGDGLLTWKAA